MGIAAPDEAALTDYAEALPPWVEVAHTHLLGADAPMAALVRRHGPFARPVTRDYYGRLVRAIVGQQISSKAAAAIYARVVAQAGGTLAPAAVRALTPDVLRACGLSEAKLRSIGDLTERALDGRLDLDRLEVLPDHDIVAQLVAVRGIGRWTAEMFLMFALARPDVLPVDDLGIQAGVQRLYALPSRPAPAAIRQLAGDGRWHPYATAASFYLWESLKD
jgi:DNA-3-methyladenine glycosylase II